MNYSKIVKSDYYLSASLGGLTYGTSTLEMASGYATLENDGKYREPTCIVKILDSDGNEIVSDKVEQKSVYKKDSAHAMVDILTGVIKRGTARGLGLDNGQPEQPMIKKTAGSVVLHHIIQRQSGLAMIRRKQLPICMVRLIRDESGMST